MLHARHAAAVHGFRCLDAAVGEYKQSPPYSSLFAPSAPTAELASGLSVPGCSAAVQWAEGVFGLSRDELLRRVELSLPIGYRLDAEEARLLGLLCGRAAREACPELEELSLRGAALRTAALQKLVEGLSGGHEGGDHELTVDLHGALRDALSERPQSASLAGEAIATLLQHAPYATEVDVGAAPFGAAGVAPIARSLADNKTLLHLGLAAAGLGPSLDGAKRLAQAIRQNGDLLSLDLRHNALTEEGIRLIKSAAAARPRPSTGLPRETLELELEPQAPLAPGMLLQRVGSRGGSAGDLFEA